MSVNKILVNFNKLQEANIKVFKLILERIDELEKEVMELKDR